MAMEEQELASLPERGLPLVRPQQGGEQAAADTEEPITGEDLDYLHFHPCFIAWRLYIAFCFVVGLHMSVKFSLQILVSYLVDLFPFFLDPTSANFMVSSAFLSVGTVFIISITSDLVGASIRLVWGGLTELDQHKEFRRIVVDFFGPPRRPGVDYCLQVVLAAVFTVVPVLAMCAEFARSDPSNIAAYTAAASELVDTVCMVSMLYTAAFYVLHVLRAWERLLRTLRQCLHSLRSLRRPRSAGAAPCLPDKHDFEVEPDEIGAGTAAAKPDEFDRRNLCIRGLLVARRFSSRFRRRCEGQGKSFVKRVGGFVAKNAHPLVPDVYRCLRDFTCQNCDMSADAAYYRNLRNGAIRSIHLAYAVVLRRLDEYSHMTPRWYVTAVSAMLAWTLLKTALCFKCTGMLEHMWTLELLGGAGNVLIILGCAALHPSTVSQWLLGAFLCHIGVGTISLDGARARAERRWLRKLEKGFGGGCLLLIAMGLSLVVMSGLNLEGTMDDVSPTCHGNRSGDCRWILPGEHNKYLFCTATLWDTPLQVLDFALFAKLAYVSPGTAVRTLEYWLPSWSMHCHHTALGVGNCGTVPFNRSLYPYDWTTFTEYRHRSRNISVIAVRGTWNAMEMLLDADIWAPAVVLQLTSLGNILPSSNTARLSNRVIEWFSPSGKRSLHYDYLKSHVMKTAQSGQVILAGHSLGGGIAKLVASEICESGGGRSCSAIKVVAISAPNVQATLQTLGLEADGSMPRTSLVNVQPQHDIVSRIDSSQGSIFPVDCAAGSVVGCHLIAETICEIISSCRDAERGIQFKKPDDAQCRSYETGPAHSRGDDQPWWR